MTTIEIKNYIHEKIDSIEDEAILLQLEEIIQIIISDSKVKYDSFNEDLKSSIAKGIKELNEDKSISYEEVKENILKELKNR
ncbi:MAG TPA: hypothetical protein PKE39_00390 [Ignavibacteria bacterium]|nr:hypothetical protein [Ignavibacteria bacterium]HMQ97453.1 hypothetical protein [Ignavibacteria bacterium]